MKEVDSKYFNLLFQNRKKKKSAVQLFPGFQVAHSPTVRETADWAEQRGKYTEISGLH